MQKKIGVFTLNDGAIFKIPVAPTDHRPPAGKKYRFFIFFPLKKNRKKKKFFFLSLDTHLRQINFTFLIPQKQPAQ